jgi:hypothetical protein
MTVTILEMLQDPPPPEPELNEQQPPPAPPPDPPRAKASTLVIPAGAVQSPSDVKSFVPFAPNFWCEWVVQEQRQQSSRADNMILIRIYAYK